MARRHRRSTRLWQIERLAELLTAVSRSLRGGHTLHTAVLRSADDARVAGPDLQRVAARIRNGAPIRHEMDRWAASLAHRDADLVRAVLGTGLATGAALADSLDRAAASLAERAELRREIDALTAQARTSAMLLTLAPLAFLALTAALDPDVLATMFSTGRGRLAAATGVVLDLLGWAWMRRMVSAVQR